MKRLALALAVAGLLCPRVARGQAFTTEADVTVGRSTDDVNAAAVQVRLFGATKTDWRFFAEVAWGRGGEHSDAFGAAYPYDKRIRPMEAYVEKTFHPGGRLYGVRMGRFRTPFGIAGRSDHAYVGFTRAPLIRYGDNWALSSAFMEAGIDVLAGTPALYVEAAAGLPSDEGQTHRRRGADVVLRAQGFYRSLIVGASVLRSSPGRELPYASGRMRFGGIDGRWMQHGVQLRGEWITGRPFDDVATRGGYLDAIVHRRAMGPVTAVARIERLDYDAGPFSEYQRRFTAGARVRVTSSVAIQLDLIRQPVTADGMRRTALDAGVTYSVQY